MAKSNNEYLKKLNEKYLKPLKMSEADLLEELKKDRGSIFSAKGGFPMNPDDQGPFPLKTINQLYFLLQIDCADFLLSRDDKKACKEKEEKWFKKMREREEKKKNPKFAQYNPELYLTWDYWEKVKNYQPLSNSLIESIPYKTLDTTKNRDLKKAYKKIAPYFEYAEKQIEVYELLFKGDNNNPGQFRAYKRPQKIIFDAIKKALENKCNPQDEQITAFRYVRTLSLSRSQEYFSKTEPIGKFIALAAEASTQSFDHILWCSAYYPGNCEFYVTTASRFRHHVIIDNKLLFTEDYVLSDNSVVPSNLTINDVTPQSKVYKLKKELQRQISKQKRDRLHDFKAEDLKRLIIKATKYVQEKIVERRNAIQHIRQAYVNSEIPDELQDLIIREKTIIDNLALQLEDLTEKLGYFT